MMEEGEVVATVETKAVTKPIVLITAKLTWTLSTLSPHLASVQEVEVEDLDQNT